MANNAVQHADGGEALQQSEALELHVLIEESVDVPCEGFTADLLTVESAVTQHCSDLNVPGCRPFKLAHGGGGRRLLLRTFHFHPFIHKTEEARHPLFSLPASASVWPPA